MLITLEEAKGYLRVDSSDEDAFITQLIETAGTQISDICRIDSAELAKNPTIVKTAQMYAVAYLFEHREEADHKSLNETLKNLLFAIRQEVF